MKLRLEKSAREAIGKRLRAIRQFNKLEQTELANQAGLSQAIISQYEKGMTEVSLSFIKFLSVNFGVSGDWLLFGAGGAPHERSPQEFFVRFSENLPEKKEKTEGNFCGIPLVDGRTAASPGRVQDDDIAEWEIIRISEAEGRRDMVALEVQPKWVENMNPPFQEGSRIVIDREDKAVRPGAYYAVNTKADSKSFRGYGVNAIRRLNLSGSRLWFVADQPQGDFEYLDIKSRDRLERIIVGRIVWVWQKLP